MPFPPPRGFFSVFDCISFRVRHGFDTVTAILCHLWMGFVVFRIHAPANWWHERQKVFVSGGFSNSNTGLFAALGFIIPGIYSVFTR